MSHPHHLKPKQAQLKFSLTPEKIGWNYLGYHAIALQAGQRYTSATEGNEAALVPLTGAATLEVGGQQFKMQRSSVFTEKPHVLYSPPGQTITVEAEGAFEFAIGTAPAEGRYPIRLIGPEEQRTEVRGGGPALREVHHTLSHPLPAERLILFEVYIPGGMWGGWPPHCHDGHLGSPYLEETYHFQFDKPAGFGLHRNYNTEQNFNEVFSVYHDDLVLVTGGYHPVAAAPGSTMYFLNYLAGELLDEARGTPPTDDPDHGWLKDNWDAYHVTLPLMP